MKGILYTLLYTMDFLFSNLLNHHRGRNNYTNPITLCTSNYIALQQKYLSWRAKTNFILRENTLRVWKPPHINSGGSRWIDLEPLCVLVPSAIDQNNNWKDFICGIMFYIDINNFKIYIYIIIRYYSSFYF